MKMIFDGVIQMGMRALRLGQNKQGKRVRSFHYFPATHEGVLTEDTVSSGNLAVTSSGVAALTFKQGMALVVNFPATVNKLNRNYPIPIDYSRVRGAISSPGFCFGPDLISKGMFFQ